MLADIFLGISVSSITHVRALKGVVLRTRLLCGKVFSLGSMLRYVLNVEELDNLKHLFLAFLVVDAVTGL